MSLLTIIRQASLELGLSNVTSVINNSDLLVQQLLAHANRESKRLRTEFDWPQLSKEYTFSLVASTEAYALPCDFDRFAYMSHWDRSNHWELMGPMSASEWQYRKSGIVTSAPRRHWRVKGLGASQFHLHPTPGTGDNAKVMVYEYYSKNCVRPREWTTATTYGTNSYTFYNGNIYSTTAGGTTGATPPTHTAGMVSDGGVNWTYFDCSYESFLADTDETTMDEEALILGIKWRFAAARNLPFEQYMIEANRAAKMASGKLRGAENLYLNSTTASEFLDYGNIPDSGYGS